MSRTIALILFTVALAALVAEIAVNVRDADFVRNGYAEIDLRLKDAAPGGAHFTDAHFTDVVNWLSKFKKTPGS